MKKQRALPKSGGTFVRSESWIFPAGCTMRRHRMTTRRWMIAVAVVGLLLGSVIGCWRLKRRWDYCLQQAENQAWMETYFRSTGSRLVSTSPPQRLSIIIDGDTYQIDKMVTYCAERKRLYLRAASRPWLSVPPDQTGEILFILEPSQTMVFERPKGIRNPESP
jgi:hypothetical protein